MDACTKPYRERRRKKLTIGHFWVKFGIVESGCKYRSPDVFITEGGKLTLDTVVAPDGNLERIAMIVDSTLSSCTQQRYQYLELDGSLARIKQGSKLVTIVRR